MSIDVMKQALEALEMLAKWEHPASNITTKTGRIYPHRVAVDAADTLRTAIEQAEKRWSEFNETTKRNIQHADWYLSTHSAPEPVGVVKVLPLGEGHKPMHWADWTDADNPPPEDTPLYTTPPAAPVQERNFCERCGKRLGDGHIHTCTPPEAPRQWIGLTEEEHTQIAVDAGCMSSDWVFYGAAVERALKEKNK